MRAVVDAIWNDLRVLPSFVVNAVEDGGFLVARVGMLVFKNFCLIEKLVMETEHTFIFAIRGEIRSHYG